MLGARARKAPPGEPAAAALRRGTDCRNKPVASRRPLLSPASRRPVPSARGADTRHTLKSAPDTEFQRRRSSVPGTDSARTRVRPQNEPARRTAEICARHREPTQARNLRSTGRVGRHECLRHRRERAGVGRRGQNLYPAQIPHRSASARSQNAPAQGTPEICTRRREPHTSEICAARRSGASRGGRKICTRHREPVQAEICARPAALRSPGGTIHSSPRREPWRTSRCETESEPRRGGTREHVPSFQGSGFGRPSGSLGRLPGPACVALAGRDRVVRTRVPGLGGPGWNGPPCRAAGPRGDAANGARSLYTYTSERGLN
jgi:hypothetical protein